MQQLGPMCIGRGRLIRIGDKFIGLFARKQTVWRPTKSEIVSKQPGRTK